MKDDELGDDESPPTNNRPATPQKDVSKLEAELATGGGAASVRRRPFGLKVAYRGKSICNGILGTLFMMPEIREMIFKFDAPSNSVRKELQVMFRNMQESSDLVDPDVFYEIFEKTNPGYLKEGNPQKFIDCLINVIDGESAAGQVKLKPLFQGIKTKYLRSRAGCGHNKSWVEEFTHLSPRSEQRVAVDKLLRSKPKQINAYCRQCEKMVDAELTTEVAVWPYFLDLYLCGTEADLAETVVMGNVKYELISAVVIDDYSNTQTFAKDFENQWFRFGEAGKNSCMEDIKMTAEGNGIVCIVYSAVNKKNSVEELKTSLEKVGCKVTMEQAKAMIKYADTNNDNKVDMIEFLAMLTRAVKSQKTNVDVEQEAHQAFEMFDTDKDGFISANVLPAMMEKLRTPLTSKEVQTMIKIYDSDKERKIDAKEFVNIWKEILGKK